MTPALLRREAGPIDFQQLTRDQQRAGVQAAQLLAEMSQRKLHAPEPSGQHAYLPEIDPIRDNHIVLIDGQRGSGKSQLMLTLLKSYRDAIMKSEILANFEGHIHPRHRIVPVGLVDLQPLPDDTNLLFHILGHLEHVVAAMEGTRGGPRQRVPAPWTEVDTQERASRQRWREFARAAPFGWGGNLQERKARLDPESYAVEMEHGELQRLDAMHRFRVFMDALVSDYQEWMHWEREQQPFFLLTIDDADMNPDHSGELLELVRKLWHRRLGFLLTGHSSLFVSKMKTQFEKQLGPRELAQAQRLAYDVYDKIIPGRQRCALQVISPDEVLRLPQAESIGATLRRFSLGGRVGDETGPEDLEALLVANSPMRASLPNRLRTLLSLQEDLKSLLSKGNCATHAVVKLWKRAVDNALDSGFEIEPFRPLVRIDDNERLTVSARLLTPSLQQTIWSPTPLRTQWDYSRVTPGEFQIHVQSGENKLELPQRMVGAFLLAHEVMRTQQQHVAEGRVIPEVAQTSFMRIRWTGWRDMETLTFNWMTPTWSFFTDFSRFVQGWNDILSATPSNTHLELDRLASGFLQLVVQIARGDKPNQDALIQDPDWASWGQTVAELSKNQGSIRTMAMREWALLHSAQLATPEAGTSPAFARKLINALANAHGAEWSRMRKEQQRGRALRMQLTITGIPQTFDRRVYPVDKTTEFTRIDHQFPHHPFTRRIAQRSGQRISIHGETFRTLDESALGRIRARQTEKLLKRNDNIHLNAYLNPFRKRLLALNPEDTLQKQGKLLRKFGDMEGGASYAVVAFWAELATARRKRHLAPRVTLNGTRVTLHNAPLRQLLHDRRRTQWAQEKSADWTLQLAQGLHVHVSQPKRTTPLIKSIPLGLEAVLRIAFDYTEDQDDHADAPLPPREWWPFVRTTLSDGSQFTPWPAVSWPSLWEWEELQEGWRKALRKARLLARSGDVGNTIIDVLAHWLVAAFSQCTSRHQISEYNFRAAPTRSDWENTMIECRRILNPGNDGLPLGQRARALAQGEKSLPLFATPESGLSNEACLSILRVSKLGDDSIEAAIPELNHLRLQRMVDAGIPETKARQSLETLDRERPDHPWVKKLGAFQLPEPNSGG
ncbi:MAG: hypothetical protein ABW123_07665 [Cystobacter sp.]